MPTGLKITIIFNCFAVALLASVFFDVDAGQRGKPVKPANPAIAALPAPAFVPSLAPSSARPLIHATQPAQTAVCAASVSFSSQQSVIFHTT